MASSLLRSSLSLVKIPAWSGSISPLIAPIVSAVNHQHQQTRGAKKWHLDHDYFKQFENAVLAPENEPRWDRPLEVRIRLNSLVGS